MKDSKNLSVFLILLIVINTPFILYLNSLYSTMFNPYFYKWNFEKNNIYDKYDDKTIPDATAKQLIGYFKSDSKDLPNINLFNQKEKEHLLDVKLLIDWSLGKYVSISIVSLLCVMMLYLIDKKRFVKQLGYSLLFGGLLTILLTIVLLISSLMFDHMFTQFHQLFFPQGNWMFPSDYNLIRLFPNSFFFDGFVVVILISFVQSFVLLLVSSSIIIKNKMKILEFYKKKQKIFK